jgi:hypothetical protein
MVSALGRWKQIIVVIDWAFLMFCIYDYYSGHRFLGSYDSTAIVICTAVMILFIKVIGLGLENDTAEKEDLSGENGERGVHGVGDHGDGGELHL